MVSESFLCWSSFYAINELALGRAYVTMCSAGVLFIFHYCQPRWHFTLAPPSAHTFTPQARRLPSPRNLSSVTSVIEICLVFTTSSSVPRPPALPLSPCCTIHLVEFSWALLPLSLFILRHNSHSRVLVSPSTSVLFRYARVIGDRLLPASHIVRRHPVLVVGILI